MLIFAYGTLKKGHYNHNRFATTLGDPVEMKDRARDFTLIQTNKDYPTAIPMKDTFVEGEVWYIRSNAVLANIVAMEIGSGYQAKLIQTEKGHNAMIFFSTKYDKQQLEALKLTTFSNFELKVPFTKG